MSYHGAVIPCNNSEVQKGSENRRVFVQYAANFLAVKLDLNQREAIFSLYTT